MFSLVKVFTVNCAGLLSFYGKDFLLRTDRVALFDLLGAQCLSVLTELLARHELDPQPVLGKHPYLRRRHHWRVLKTSVHRVCLLMEDIQREYAHRHKHNETYRKTNTDTHTYTRVCACGHTHTHAHTRLRVCAHTHTHLKQKCQ